MILLKIVLLPNLDLIVLISKRLLWSCEFALLDLWFSYFIFKSMVHFEFIFTSVKKHNSVATVVYSVYMCVCLCEFVLLVCRKHKGRLALWNWSYRCVQVTVATVLVL